MTKRRINLLITFLVSGAWHGNGMQFIVWGLLHAVYQIAGEFLRPINEWIKKFLGVRRDSLVEVWMDRIITFIFVMFAWILFRSNTLSDGLAMIVSIFCVHNPWLLFNDSFLEFGLDLKDMMILIISIYFMFKIELTQESGQLRDRVMRQPLFVRWTIYLGAIAMIIIWGNYGYGFEASDFIYRGF